MLFTDPIFLFGFLPAALLLFHLCRRFLGGSQAIWFLVAASAAFYGYWSVKYLALLLSQILINYLLARRLASTRSRALLWTAIAFNLALLGYFKYRNFFFENVELLTGWELHVAALFVPLGISFHTFQQIAFLTDVADAEEAMPPLPRFALFVLFFPQLIAGPIVLHRELGRQLARLAGNHRLTEAHLGAGFTLFCYGLFKKLCLADTLAPNTDLTWTWPQPLHFIEAWLGTVNYALQLYFDFSGYSDMAVGLGLMFGFVLPANFNIPYAATSMTEYWKRWHITMTRFFTMYVYTPVSLAAHRFAASKDIRGVQAFLLTVGGPTLVAFLASGLWHGAGWTFILFGLVNGAGLIINHAWREAGMPKLPKAIAWTLTALTILVSLVYFRSASVAQAHYMLKIMLWPDRIDLPVWAAGLAARLHLQTGFFQVLTFPNFTLRYCATVLLLAALSVVLPNLTARPLEIAPNYRTAFAVSVMLGLSVGMLGTTRTFLYFQF